MVKIERDVLVDVVVQAVLDEREVVGDDLHRDDVGARLLGELGEQRPGGVLGSRGARRCVETVRTAVRTARTISVSRAAARAPLGQ